MMCDDLDDGRLNQSYVTIQHVPYYLMDLMQSKKHLKDYTRTYK